VCCNSSTFTIHAVYSPSPPEGGAQKLGWGRKLAKHLDVLTEVISSAEGYYRSHRTEVEALIEANQKADFEVVKRKFPGVRRLD
jgi:hypothetical protein